MGAMERHGGNAAHVHADRRQDASGTHADTEPLVEYRRFISRRADLRLRQCPQIAGCLLDIEFDLLSHELVCRTSRGEIRKIPLRPVSVAQFFEEFTKTLASLGVSVKIDPMPVEVANPIRCDIDTVHCSYDSDAVTRFWHTLRIADTLLKRFSTNFYGKISPVHFFWGSFDLAVTRFNGKRAPARPGADAVQAEAYSHEVISAGFWPGNGGYGSSRFLCLCRTPPDGTSKYGAQRQGRF